MGCSSSWATWVCSSELLFGESARISGDTSSYLFKYTDYSIDSIPGPPVDWEIGMRESRCNRGLGLPLSVD